MENDKDAMDVESLLVLLVSTQATYSIIRTAKQLMALYLHILDVLKRFMKISRNKIIIENFPIIYMD